MPAAIQARFRSAEPIHVIQERLEGHTAPVEDGFTLVHRLSGAGVVVRTLRAPDTERALFGKVGPQEFSVAFVPSAGDVTPYHPILRGRFAAQEEDGTTLELELAHHPDARTMAPMYGFGALILGIGAILRFGDSPLVLFGSLGLAVLFAVFPTLQARLRFAGACHSAASRFAELLRLEAQP